LDVPQVTLVSHKLKKLGYEISDDNLTVSELVEELCQLS